MDQLNGADPRAVGDVLNMDRGAKELRQIASDLGVSRERGDTKRQTAQRIVNQAPWALEVEWGWEGDPELFQVRVDRNAERPTQTVSMERAVQMAGTKRLAERLQELKNAVDLAYRYEAQATVSNVLYQVTITSDQNWRREGELGLDKFRAELTPQGGIRTLERIDVPTRETSDFLSGSAGRRSAWSSFLSAVRRAE